MRRWILILAIIACVMLAGCKISGTVKDDGSPVAGVTVTLTGPVTKTAVTNSKGEFSFTPFKTGTYTVQASSTNYNFTPDSEEVELSVTPATVRFEARLASPRALVIVNSASSGYSDYTSIIKPLLDASPAVQTVLDISSANIGSASTLRAAYDVIIIGHRQIDISNAYLNSTEQSAISGAVAEGVGFVNFDNDLVKETEGTAETFSCVDNSYQSPVITQEGLDEDDDMWSEYAHSRPFTSLFAYTSETVPVMRFHKEVSNGYYKVYARLYNPGHQCRYYFGLSKSDPMDQFVDTNGGLAGEEYQHNWYFLDNVKVTSSEFSLYVKNAQYLGTYNYYFGWAEIKLVPVTVTARYQFVTDIFNFKYTPSGNESHILLNSGYLIMCSENDVQDPDVTMSTLLPADGQWSEYSYNRPFSSVMGYSTEFLPVMNFHKDDIEDGEYDVYANVYTTHDDATYYYGWNAEDTTGKSFETTKNTTAQKYEHTEYYLETRNFTDSFDMYVQDAELESSTPYYFGWAWIRLAPVDAEPHKIISDHKAADTIFTVDGTLKAITMKMAGITLPTDDSVDVVASTLTGSRKPVIAATNDFNGLIYAVQFGTYDWLNLGITGYDDLITNAIDWASF